MPNRSSHGERCSAVRSPPFSQLASRTNPTRPLQGVWPKFVTDEGPEVQALYEFQLTQGEIMRYIPCFCGCGGGASHRNNRDCYIASIDANGIVEFDSMAPFAVVPDPRPLLTSHSIPKKQPHAS